MNSLSLFLSSREWKKTGIDQVQTSRIRPSSRARTPLSTLTPPRLSRRRPSSIMTREPLVVFVFPPFERTRNFRLRNNPITSSHKPPLVHEIPKFRTRPLCRTYERRRNVNLNVTTIDHLRGVPILFIIWIFYQLILIPNLEFFISYHLKFEFFIN